MVLGDSSLVVSKEIVLEVNAEKTKYVFLYRDELAGENTTRR
jgi:hypothetical protein